ncbi:glycosyltransferase 36 [Burkholderia plantarii]|uniref:Glycosyltransferase 36 n=1 Tax=Burkholderia plantarii TaxID=41899 RepID=A0A0B6S2V9_BURPL|nr:glucoamylase family protein [Burkholderia plantarii]AJK49998.1 glycosyltransferase 36 [Burkholderia plantarii]
MLRGHFAGGKGSPWDNTLPIREEFFGEERLAQHAESLALAQQVAPRRAFGPSLARRLKDNADHLLKAYRNTAVSDALGEQIMPAAEWLLDNYYVVAEQVREVRDDLSPRYYRQLPKLGGGPFAGYPRVLGISWAFVAHTDSRFDPDLLCRFMLAYQAVEPLTIGELWAVGITLRIVLIENLRRLADQITGERQARLDANALADRLLGEGGQARQPSGPLMSRYEYAVSHDAFAVQLIQRLHDHDPAIAPVLSWLHRQLAARGTTPELIVAAVNHEQGAASLTVRNVITSLRLISDVDWTELFERISPVDQVLRNHPGFVQMDFPTRNRYRDAVETLARGSRVSEREIACRVVADAQAWGARRASDGTGAPIREADPGYHLLAGGRAALEASIGYRAPVALWWQRLTRRTGLGGYLGRIGLFAVVLLAAILAWLARVGTPGPWLVGLGVAGLLPVLDVAVALVNRGVMHDIGASPLPGLDLLDGIPPELRTMVAVPMLLSSEAALAEQIEHLEIHHLASPGGALHFALLSDWVDAPVQRLARDDALLASAMAGIDRLNQRHPAAPGEAPRFLLLHRERVWNAGERCWMGWERKRGKLHELNRLLRGASDTSFLARPGRPPVVPGEVRYVITLDADTRLLRDTVRRLIGKMAHPLNRPVFDRASQRIIEGYGVLQPRVSASLASGDEGSLFQRVSSSAHGIDPYTSAVSDLYQDLFDEGSYAGKGIYDIDAFEAALAGRVPDNTVLSHDLFEGIFARAGLASDIEVVEAFPSRYDVAAARLHRWARGDWQLLPWLVFGRGPLPAVGRWKMLDNLRRTLTEPAWLLALLVGWLLPSTRASLAWSAFVLATIALPLLLPALSALLPNWRRAQVKLTARSLFREWAVQWGFASLRFGLSLIMLPQKAWSMGDAIARTLFRVGISRRHLLEWTTAAEASARERPTPGSTYLRMRGGVALSLLGTAAVLAASWCLDRPAGWLVVPFAAAWLAAPALAYWLSRAPRSAGDLAVAPDDARQLRLDARRTWRYFERFVTADDQMLPPDNFQEDPKPVVAHRTSPTNLGLYLLSTVSAREFGWLGTQAAVSRLEATLATMERLARHRGHFYNWYDTRNLQPLEPRYVSSVDSGNLAGHLIALGNGCRAWANQAHGAGRQAVCAGIGDTLALLREALGRGGEVRGILRGEFEQAADELADALVVAGAAANGEEGMAELHASPAWSTILTRVAAVADVARALMDEAAWIGRDEVDDVLFWAQALEHAVQGHDRDAANTPGEAAALAGRLHALADVALRMAYAMEFGFLLDPVRKLLSIGYAVADGRLDPGNYDLLASEARLASFVAIAKGDVPVRHWFRLGRLATPVGQGAAMISWSGSMFEYLMPSLVMRAPASSLMARTNQLVVRRQIAYGDGLRLPWGMSESAYNARDIELTYQYSSFGVPELGLKRDLAQHRVVAPYASALAAMVAPRAAARNFERLRAAGAGGRYGFYEALDYTPSRVPEGLPLAVVYAFMAHHQGMTIVSIANALLAGRIRAFFHAEPAVRATELLLQERVPSRVAAVRPRVDAGFAGRVRGSARTVARRMQSADDPAPVTHLLSNGRYAVMLTSAGSGYSRRDDLAVTRWHEDATRDDWGSYLYLRDLDSGAVWSAGWQPTGAVPDSYDVSFTEDRAEFVRRDGSLTTTLEVVVSAEDDAEVRRISLANTGTQARVVEITSYAEIVLAPSAADHAHPAFSKLFVETEYLPAVGAILATRRQRSPNEPQVWAAHLTVGAGEPLGAGQFETDRMRFIGRGRSVRQPLALAEPRALGGTSGTVLDAVFSLRRRLRIEPGAKASLAYWTLVADSREQLLDLIDKYRDGESFARAAMLAWTQAQVQLRHSAVSLDEAALFQQLAGCMLYSDPLMRPNSATLLRHASAAAAAGGVGAAPLWAHGVSGDLPILLVRIDDIEHIAMVRQLIRAHEYWHIKRLAVDLVIINERAASYVQDLQAALEGLVRNRPSPGQAGRGAVFVLRADLMAAAARSQFPVVARAVFAARNGRLVDQLRRLTGAPLPGRPDLARAAEPPRAQPAPRGAQPGADLEYFNGIGGFARDGREYAVILQPGQSTPMPWVNVVANPVCGFLVSAEGGGHTWVTNSREHPLTPWSNDPVTDPPGEAFYVRDDETGMRWGPRASPIRDDTPDEALYLANHGQGYSRFSHGAAGIAVELLQFVPLADPVKISRLSLRNLSGRPRRLSVAAYVEWALGASRGAAAPHVVTELDAVTGAVFARNDWSQAYRGRVAFADLGGLQTSWTADRREFVGRNGALGDPAGFPGSVGAAAPLSGRVGAALDPCAALQTTIDLAPGETAEIVMLLGEGSDVAAARQLIGQYRQADLDAVLAEVTAFWDETLGAIRIETPDRAMDLMLNRWLLYQTLSSRIWARAGFYQASGAYGLRDQLQDGMALAVARPALTREHLLRAAARQFPDGDLQHWWLPESGSGVRTRISDDRVWLAYTAAHYVEVSGDLAVLDVAIPFLEGRPLAAGESDAFFIPGVSETTASLFEHCARALEQSLALFGAHGLPLIGTGDWNDGMNRVGEAGRGESVWLGWFLHATLGAFAPLAAARGESERARRWGARADALREALDDAGWDGGWYRRGYFDDGTPLGSAGAAGCAIDSIAQSWSVLSGAADPARAAQAMAALDAQLIRDDEGLALLFTPPFDRAQVDPGYIRGYPPGIRENGGQYTHAASWSVLAFARLGDGERAASLFALLNPVHRSRTRSGANRYRVEPYVVAADIYSVAPHVGRGGWTWYTGSAGWLYRAGIEGLLGLRKQGDMLTLRPCIPRSWPGFSATLRHGAAHYDIVIDNSASVATGVARIVVDGVALESGVTTLRMVDDGRRHPVHVTLGHAQPVLP